MANRRPQNTLPRPQTHSAMALLAQARSAGPDDSTTVFVDEHTNAGETSLGNSITQPVRVARSGYGKLKVYVLTPDGVSHRHVAVQSIAEVLSSPNYAAECFDCGTDCTPCSGVKCTSDINNGCPGREPRKFRVCPERACSKRIYDSVPTGQYLSDEFDHSDRDADDENAIVDNEYSKSTPEQRTKAKLDLHIIAVHPALAMEQGISKPAELPRLAVVS